MSSLARGVNYNPSFFLSILVFQRLQIKRYIQGQFLWGTTARLMLVHIAGAEIQGHLYPLSALSPFYT